MRQHTHNWFLNVVLFFGAIFIGSWPQAVLAQLSCPITPITNTPNGEVVFGLSANNDVTRLAFVSTSDIVTGSNPNNLYQVFVFNTNTNSFTQITHKTTEGFFGVESAINGVTGGVPSSIAVVSDSPPAGGGSVSDRSELFLFNGTTFTQLTDGGNSPGTFPNVQSTRAVSVDGTRITFTDLADLTGENPDANGEVFLFNNNTLTQITNSVDGDTFGASMSTDGTRIAFASNRNLTAQNADGSFEIFLFEVSTSTLRQITDTENNGPFSFAPSLNANGTRIAFVSTGDLLGTNTDQSSEVFLFDTTNDTLTQITNTTGNIFSNFPIITPSGAGQRIAFTSNMNGGGVFIVDTATGGLTQIGNQEPAAAPVISADGNRIAFRVDQNIFLAVCSPEGADLRIFKTDSPDPVVKGNNLTYNITADNTSGPSDATDTVFDDTLPPNTTFQSLTVPTGWSCTTPAVGSTGTVHCSTPNLPFLSSPIFTLVVRVSPNTTSGTTFNNTATISSNTADPNTANNTVTQTTSVTTSSQAIKLSVTAQGRGTVTSNPPGINCRGTCSANFNQGTQVTLTATPDPGNQFTGWRGACTNATGTCTVTLNTSQAVRAAFRRI
jgi:uncharacterized repeat protein (TIGR01451 family)